MNPNPPKHLVPTDRLEAVVTLVIPKEHDDQPSNHKLKYFELAVSLIKAVAWPLFALLLLWMLRAPIRAIVEKFPEMVAQADSFKISAGTGGVAMELQRAAQAAARQAGRPELAERIGNLSAGAIAELIRQNESSQIITGTEGLEPNVFTLPSEEALKPVFELESKGLVEFGPMTYEQFRSFTKQLGLRPEGEIANREKYRATRPLTPDEYVKLTKQYYRLTDAGKQVYKFIVDSIIKDAQPEKSPSR